MRDSVQIDTSHYAECSTLLIKFRNNHEKRLVALVALLLINFYLQTYYFAVNHSGESLQIMATADPALRPSPVGGLAAILYLAFFICGGVLLFKRGKNRKILYGYLAVNFLFMVGASVYRTVKNAEILRELGAEEIPRVSHLAYGYGILTLFASILCIVVAFFSEQKRPKVFAALLLLLLLFTIAGCYLWFTAAVMIGMYLAAIPEYVKMHWVEHQPGYPYFNERFDWQQSHAEYEPLHKLDQRSYGEMADVDDNSAVPAYFREKEQEHRKQQEQLAKPQMDYTLKYSSDPSEMPGIDEIFEHIEPEPEKPAEIPDTNWELPEINTDIPDLPEIPDIPKL